MFGAILVVYNLSWCMFSGSIRDWINSSRRLLRLHFSLPTLASISQVASIVLIEPADSILHQLHLHHHHHEHGPGHDHHDAVKLIAGSGQSANDRCVPQSSSDHSLHSHNVIIIIITNIAINANIQMKNNASMTKNYPNCMAVVGQVVSAGASYEPSV